MFQKLKPMAERRCRICGRVLKKTSGDIGPVCAGGKRHKKMSHKTYIKLFKRYEIFKETEDGQTRNEAADTKTSREES